MGPAAGEAENLEVWAAGGLENIIATWFAVCRTWGGVVLSWTNGKRQRFQEIVTIPFACINGRHAPAIGGLLPQNHDHPATLNEVLGHDGCLVF